MCSAFLKDPLFAIVLFVVKLITKRTMIIPKIIVKTAIIGLDSYMENSYKIAMAQLEAEKFTTKNICKIRLKSCNN